ncbi:hypothetical protein KKE28_01765, partial [Patescibacteria group bacterium]|nr:hypothetical protein [Patescibacteria group bacterium]
RQPLIKFSQTRDSLEGYLWTVLPVGLTGETAENTFARACISLMGIERSSELAETMAAVGLAAGLATLLCLGNEGFTAARERVR